MAGYQEFVMDQSNRYANLNLKESDLIAQYERRVVDVNEKLSHKMTIEAASKPEMKFWPKRGFITIISVLATFMATSLILVFFELYSSKSQS